MSMKIDLQENVEANLAFFLLAAFAALFIFPKGSIGCCQANCQTA